MRDANATITSVVTPGDLDAYGDATTGTVVWTGKLPVYLRRPRMGGHPRGGTGTDREDDQRVDEAIFPATGADSLIRVLASGDAAEASRVMVTDVRSSVPVDRVYELVGLDHRAGGLTTDSVRLMLRREA